MGRLAGFTYRDVATKLRRAGFKFDRSGKGSHEIWRRETDGRRTMVPNHPGDLSEGTVRAVINQAGLSVGEFLAL